MTGMLDVYYGFSKWVGGFLSDLFSKRGAGCLFRVLISRRCGVSTILYGFSLRHWLVSYLCFEGGNRKRNGKRE